MAVHVVTGGAGFIGSHITDALIARGDKVIVLDNLSTGKAGNLSDAGSSVDLRQVDLATETNLERHLARVDTVFHQAAIPSVPRSISEPLASHRANVTATLSLLVACRDAGVGRVVYASSSAVYGDDPTLPKHEDMAPAPMSPYGAQKYFGEVYANVFWQSFGLEAVSLRYFNVFGPRQDASSEYSGVFARFIPAVLDTHPPTIYGDGLQTRDFLFVDDVVRANLCAAEAERAPGRAFNVASGKETTVREVLDETLSLTGSQVEPVHEDSRIGDIRHSLADISNARETLGWSPSIPFKAGLEQTIDWYGKEMSSGK